VILASVLPRGLMAMVRQDRVRAVCAAKWERAAGSRLHHVVEDWKVMGCRKVGARISMIRPDPERPEVCWPMGEGSREVSG